MTTGALTTRSWADEGTELLLAALDRLTDADLDTHCALPGWSRRHLLAHLASNADALVRLLAWARTGVESRMYASPEQRASEIEAGAARPDLRARVRDSAAALGEAMDTLPTHAWQAEVLTAQGRTVPATEICWMRARETCVHAVDLDAGVSFTDLPPGFCATLLDDVAGRRSARPGPALDLRTPGSRHRIAGDGTPATVELPLATAAAWLAGRHTDPALPALPRWL